MKLGQGLPLGVVHGLQLGAAPADDQQVALRVAAGKLDELPLKEPGPKMEW